MLHHYVPQFVHKYHYDIFMTFLFPYFDYHGRVPPSPLIPNNIVFNADLSNAPLSRNKSPAMEVGLL
jgi:hypothetical protein